jgi:hypothetical protein
MKVTAYQCDRCSYLTHHVEEFTRHNRSEYEHLCTVCALGLERAAAAFIAVMLPEPQRPRHAPALAAQGGGTKTCLPLLN